ncbi:hypothetical protein AGMMS49991_12020 [Spirochaetia bacterium]|nr:hypothetical protein AGMMS49991_12020 [Spirochaetia bacterium]
MIVQINESALRHGIAEEDIHRALSMVVFDGLLPQYANKYLLPGFDRNSNLLEIWKLQCLSCHEVQERILSLCVGNFCSLGRGLVWLI